MHTHSGLDHPALAPLPAVTDSPHPRCTASVTGLHIERLGRTSQPSTISYLDAGVVYIGSACGDSQLIRCVRVCVVVVWGVDVARRARLPGAVQGLCC